jgi:hypothetical protein
MTTDSLYFPSPAACFDRPMVHTVSSHTKDNDVAKLDNDIIATSLGGWAGQATLLNDCLQRHGLERQGVRLV